MVFPYVHHLRFQFVPLAPGLVPHPCAVVVDGRGGVAEELRDLHAVGNAQADEREDAQFDVELVPGLRHNRFARL